MRRTMLVVVMGATLLSPVACGGGGGGTRLTEAEYVRRGNLLCKNFTDVTDKALTGLVILGNAAFATTVSVVFIGWMLVIYGVIALTAALFLIGKGGFWSAALSGALMLALGCCSCATRGRPRCP